MKLSVIIPFYNERPTLEACVERVLEHIPEGMEAELLLIDDGSTDGSGEVADALAQGDERFTVVHHPRNLGKGAALRTAQEYVTGDVALIQDADLEYSPHHYPTLIRPIAEGQADVVYGNRFGGVGPKRVLYYRHELGNRFLTALSNLTTDLALSDLNTGYKVFAGDLFKRIPLQSEGFSIEAELTAKVSKLNLRVFEVPIDYYGRTYFAGKKAGWRDGLRAIFTILKYWVVDGLKGMDEGLETLQAMRYAQRYNAWTFRCVADAVGQRILEAGSGIGNLTQYLLDRERVVAVDANEDYVQRLTQVFRHQPNVQCAEQDLTDLKAYERWRSEDLDTVICINVLEHLEPDEDVLKAFHDVLQPGGRTIVLVPQGMNLYGEIDRAVGHYRRYDRAELETKLRNAGFEVERMIELNRIAPLGWYISGRLLGKSTVDPLQTRVFDYLVPLMRLVDRWLPILPPLSLIVVGRVPQTTTAS